MSDKLKKSDQPEPIAAEKLDQISAGSWFTCLRSCADSKSQVQVELARFR